MRMIVAIIQPTKLSTVRAALRRIGVDRMTVMDVEGYGRQKGQTPSYRGLEYRIQMLRKVQLEIVVNEDFVERTIEILSHAARQGTSGEIGDGKIFVVPTGECIDMATGKSGPGAV